jgi:hypothetical protein
MYMAIKLNTILNIVITFNFNFKLMIKVKAWERKHVKRVSLDLNTFLQMWEKESQHTQMVFPLWKLESHELLIF